MKKKEVEILSSWQDMIAKGYISGEKRPNPKSRKKRAKQMRSA